MRQLPWYMYGAGLCRMWTGIFNRIARQCVKMDMSTPQRVCIYLTHRCNAACVYCLKRHECKHELSTVQWLAIIDDLKQWLKFFTLYIGGGEPCLRSDLIDIVRYAHKKGIVTDLSTNGSLMNASLAASLKVCGLDGAAVSVDGDQVTHDALRGKGTHAKALKAIDLLRGVTRVCVKTTIFGSNLNSIPNLIDLCRDWGVQISFQGLLMDERSEFLWPSDKKQLEDFFLYLRMYKRKYSHVIRDTDAYLDHLSNYCMKGPISLKDGPCMMSYEIMRIDPAGQVRICEARPPLGEAAQMSVESIWNSAHARYVRRTMRSCQSPCSYLKGGYSLSLPETIKTAWQYLSQ